MAVKYPVRGEDWECLTHQFEYFPAFLSVVFGIMPLLFTRHYWWGLAPFIIGLPIGYFVGHWIQGLVLDRLWKTEDEIDWPE